MEGWYDGDFTQFNWSSSDLGYPDGLFQEPLEGRCAERADYTWFYDANLLEEQKLLAGFAFIGGWFAIFRWAAFNDIGDEYIVALESGSF